MILETLSDIGSWRRRAQCAPLVFAALVTAGAVILAAIPLSAQQIFAGTVQLESAPARQPDKTGNVTWEGASLRIGESVRIDPRVRVQADVLVNDQTSDIDDRFSWGSRRIGIDGELFNRVAFQIERALQDDDDDDTAWRDVYVDVRLNRALRIRGGRFKVPFSMERTTSRDELDFLQRATAVRALSPGRDIGVMVHGRLADRLVNYEVAVMQHSDSLDVLNDANVWGPIGAMLAGRVAFEPIRDNDDGLTRELHLGAAFVRSTIPEGLNGVVGRTFAGERFFERMNVNGQRTRLGAEGLWNARRFTLKGELLQLIDQRTQQSVTGEDLSDLIQRGGYITGIYRAFGEHGRKGQAVDVAARLDRLSIGSGNQTDEPFTNPRADHVAPLSKNTWTFGVTYQINNYFRIQGNAIREQLVDPLDIQDLTFGSPWTTVVRFQFSL